MLLGVLELTDFAAIAAIVAFLAGGAALTTRRDFESRRLQSQVDALERKLDSLLKHLGVQAPSSPPSGLSPEVERLASDPASKIAAIKLYRRQNPGATLLEAKIKIEQFAARRR